MNSNSRSLPQTPALSLLRPAWPWQASREAMLASVAYFLVGCAWIALSDQLGMLLFSSPEQLASFQSYKGVGFVAVTAILLFTLMALRGAGRQEHAALPSRFPRAGLGAWLLTLVLITGLPLIALVGVGVYRETAHDVEAANQLVAAVTTAAARQTAELAGAQDHLAAMLAKRPRISSLSATGCDPILADVLTVRTNLSNVVTVDGSGLRVCAGDESAHAALAGMPGWLGDLRAGAPRVVSHPVRDQQTGEWEIVMAYPLRQGAELRGALAIVLKLAAIEAIAAAAPRAGAVMSILDADRFFLARTGSPGLTGTQFPETPDAAVVRIQRNGELTGVGPDGIRRLYSFREIEGTPWFAISGVPTQAIYGVAQRNALLYGGAGLLALALAAWMVMNIARRITQPMGALSETAHRVSLGMRDERAPVAGPAEVARVAEQFNNMLDKLPAVEQELRELAARNQSLVELAPDGILVQDGRTPVYANAGFRNMFGLANADSLVHLSLVDMTVPSQRCQMASRMARLEVDPGTSITAEFKMQRADGEVIEVEHSASSVLLHGHCIAVQSYLRDVTVRNQRRRELEETRQHLEERVRERTAALEASNDALSSFSRSVAHDLRSPLTLVGGFASLLSRALGKGDLAAATSHSERIQRNVAGMAGMIDGLLKISRSDAKALELAPVDMKCLAQDVLVEHNAYKLAAVTLGELPTVTGDETLLRQVWRNLISNALKYSAKAQRPTVCVDAVAEHGGWTFTVADNGVGFDNAQSKDLFKPFGRLPGSEEFEGTGVGMSIARRIVERHGGTIGATGRPGEGATFHFWLRAGPGVTQASDQLP